VGSSHGSCKACNFGTRQVLPSLSAIATVLRDLPEGGRGRGAFDFEVHTEGLNAYPLLVCEVTQILERVGKGDPKAAEELLPLVYEELRRLAAVRMANEKPGQTLQPTALVHEAWLRIAGKGNEHFANRGHFFRAAASAMQHILIDVARRKQRLKHGVNQVGDPLDESRIAISVPSEELLAVNEALTLLALEDPQLAEVVQLRYFVGMTVPEIAAALDLAPRTVDRHWAYARAWLKRTIRASLSGQSSPA
jgi:RNA polymerase sigma factor (TIGR02999 family)